MNPITPSSLNAIFLGFNTLFQKGLQRAEPRTKRFSMQVPSSGRANVYAFMAQLLRARQWLGERMIQNISAHPYTLTNLPFENTVAVDRDDIEDDNLGVYNPLLEELGMATSFWLDDLTIAAMQNGQAAAANTFDGVPFFSTSHPVDPSGQVAGTQSNYAASGVALTAPNYAAKRASMMGLLGHDGKPMGIIPDLLVVPPALEGAARTILNADMISDGAGAGITNVWKGSADLLVVEGLAGADTTWYLMSTKRAVQPFVQQTRRVPQLVRMDQERDQNVFMRRQFIYGTDMRGNAGYGLWFLAAKYSA